MGQIVPLHQHMAKSEPNHPKFAFGFPVKVKADRYTYAAIFGEGSTHGSSDSAHGRRHFSVRLQQGGLSVRLSLGLRHPKQHNCRLSPPSVRLGLDNKFCSSSVLFSL